jgi:ATPases with chaperone activity, ATP-binding subunit
MFERLTDKARRVVVGAQEQARERQADAIRTEHLLASLFTVPDNLAVVVLAGQGVSQADITSDIDALPGLGPSDAEALATLGIDLDEVRRQVEEAFGPGALDRTRAAIGRGRRTGGNLPFDRATKKALELALREAVHLEHNHIGTEHLLLGMLHTETGSAQHILDARGVRLEPTRALVAALVRGRAAS